MTQVANHTNRSMNETCKPRIDHSGPVALPSRSDTCGHDTIALSNRLLLRPSAPDPNAIPHVDLSVLLCNVRSSRAQASKLIPAKRRPAKASVQRNDVTERDTCCDANHVLSISRDVTVEKRGNWLNWAPRRDSGGALNAACVWESISTNHRVDYCTESINLTPRLMQK